MGFILAVIYSFWASERPGEEVISGFLGWTGFVLLILGTIRLGITFLGRIQKRSSKE